MKNVIRSVLFVLIVSSVLHVERVYVYATTSIRSDVVLAYTNAERYKRGLPLLMTDDALSRVAQKKMTDLFARQYFAHEAPTGESVSDLAKGAGYEYIVVGENLAMGGFVSSKEVVDAWMNSKGHRENILSESYSEIGIAAGRGLYEGRETWMIVQSFGYPRSSCPAVDEDLRKKVEKMDALLSIYNAIAEKREKLLQDESAPLEVRKARVESYNVVARLYNKTVGDYKKVVERYNEEVDGYNACVKKVSAKLEH